MAPRTRPSTPKPPRDAAVPVDAESRARLFASVMANANDAVLVTEAEPVDRASGGPRILYVNEAFEQMTGFSAADAVGATPRLLQSPRTDQAELDRLRVALQRWKPVQVELLNVRKDGTEFWVQFSIVPVADADGWYTHWVSIQRDVTERRRRDEELAAMLRDTRDIVALVDRDGIVRAASPAADRALAGPGATLVGATLASLPGDPRAAAAAEALLDAARTPTAPQAARELRLRTPGGVRTYEATARATSLDADAPIVLTATDVTEAHASRAALLTAQRRFAGAFADAPIGMAMLARDGRLLAANRQLCQLVGRYEEQLLALGLDDLIHPDDRRDSEAERLAIFAGSARIGRRETRMLHADGRVVGVMLSSSVVRRDDEVAELVVHIEDISERKALEARLTHQALHDPLTRLPNRALFLDRLQTALRRAGRSQAPVSVLFLDVDRFKAVNDSYGHEAGDLVLRTVAGRLQDVMRPGDTAARFAGDEFTILCDDTDLDAAVSIARRIAAAIEAPIPLPVHGPFRLRASIGIASTRESGATADDLLRDADAAMYAAKGDPDVAHAVFDERLRRRGLARMDEEHALRRAIAGGELVLHYQPVTVLDGRDAAPQFEALVRWEDPERGLLPPHAFLALAEESGLSADLDRWVLRRACADLAGLGLPGARVWVNLSPAAVAQAELPDRVATALAEAGLPAAALGLELGERALSQGAEPVQHPVLERVRGLGVALAADNVGVGPTSLAMLAGRPVDVLKLDRAVVAALPDARDAAVVRAVVALATTLGLRTVAAGVEREEQLAAVRDLGCDGAQGFLLARPMPLAELAAHVGACVAR